MQISPKVGMVFYGIVAAIALGGVAILPSFVPPDTAKAIVSTCAFIVAVVAGTAGASHAFSSSTPGPLAPQDPPIVTAVSDGASKQQIQTMAENPANLVSPKG